MENFNENGRSTKFLASMEVGSKIARVSDLTFLGRLAMPRLPRCLQWTEEACYHLMDRAHNTSPSSPTTKTAMPSSTWSRAIERNPRSPVVVA